MTTFAKSDKNRVRRVPQRGQYDAATIYAILDEALICHVGFYKDEQPFVIPTIHVRDGDRLLLHGSAASRMLQHLQQGYPFCVTATILDGLVLARSVFHHSMNYRSAVLFGSGTLVEREDEKWEALARFTEKLMPGRWQDARQPTPVEMKATAVVAMEISSASAKVRSGPPGDEEEDYALPVWAGVLPIRQQILPPETDPRLSAGIPMPAYVDDYVAKHG